MASFNMSAVTQTQGRCVADGETIVEQVKSTSTVSFFSPLFFSSSSCDPCFTDAVIKGELDDQKEKERERDTHKKKEKRRKKVAEADASTINASLIITSSAGAKEAIN